MQQQLDFTQVVHQIENNPESQSILNDNKEHFSEQCRVVYEVLKSGGTLTVKSAINIYGIWSLPRRVKDLRDKGIMIQARLIKKRFKEYYL